MKFLLAPKDNVLRAMLALQHDPNFKVLAEYLDEGVRALDVKNRSITDAPIFHQNQGAAGALAEALQQINDAKVGIERGLKRAA